MENAMEKYKKKLQEAADLRQAAKVRLSVYYRYPLSLSLAVTGKTKCRSGRPERVFGRRISQGGRIQATYGVVQEPNC
jgi:hypothetical protein